MSTKYKARKGHALNVSHPECISLTDKSYKALSDARIISSFYLNKSSKSQTFKITIGIKISFSQQFSRW